ncbi:hypothetical protein [Roseovarius ramblicola]|uniref:Aspartate carbamoyltransferase catalytic subunit n=1 Tax=Roseovarius ramblicola TaxID=2022336 RepID=A0ABV5HYI1_9RHOB
MSTQISIPAQEAHVVRVFSVIEEAGAPMDDAAVMAALGADRDLEAGEIELFGLGDLGSMPLSEYLAEGHGIAEADLAPMRGQIDGLRGRVLIVPSRAFGGRATVLRPGRGLRLVARFEEDVAPVSFDPLPAGGAAGSVAPATRSARPVRRPAWLAALVFFAGIAVLLALAVWLMVTR